MNRSFDDVGVYDSIILAKPYRFVLETSGLPPTLNVQMLDAARLSLRALRACAVKLLITEVNRSDLPDVGAPGQSGHTYEVRDTSPRVQRFELHNTRFMDIESLHRQLRDPNVDLQHELLLDEVHRPAGIPATRSTMRSAEMGEARYQRPGPDEIVVRLNNPRTGYIQVIESWDPGWHATIDGAPVPLLAGDDTFLAVFVPAGAREIRFRFSTPGLAVGVIISIFGTAALMILAFMVARSRRPSRSQFTELPVLGETR
jgi:hypothetical protein